MLIRHPNVPLIKKKKKILILHDVQIRYSWFILYPLRRQISKTTLIKKKPFYIMMVTSYDAVGSQDNYGLHLKRISAWAISSVSEYWRRFLELESIEFNWLVFEMKETKAQRKEMIWSRSRIEHRGVGKRTPLVTELFETLFFSLFIYSRPFLHLLFFSLNHTLIDCFSWPVKASRWLKNTAVYKSIQGKVILPSYLVSVPKGRPHC